MNSNKEFQDWYSALTNSEKQIALARVCSCLSAYGRTFRSNLPVTEQNQRFQGLNELHHDVANHIAAIGQGYAGNSDDALYKSLAETASAYGLTSYLAESFAQVKLVSAAAANELRVADARRRTE